jgi:hypothetical protein
VQVLTVPTHSSSTACVDAFLRSCAANNQSNNQSFFSERATQISCSVHKNCSRLVYASSLRQQRSQPPCQHDLHRQQTSSQQHHQRCQLLAKGSNGRVVVADSPRATASQQQNNNKNKNNNRTSVPPAPHGPGHTSAQKSFFHAAHQTDDAHHTTHPNSSEDSLDSDDNKDRLLEVTSDA